MTCGSRLPRTPAARGAFRNASSAPAPYLNIQVDGETDDWKDAIPATFDSAGKKTVVRTAYTRRNFFLLVGVEQAGHRPMTGTAGPCDAVQIAVAHPRGGHAHAGRRELAGAEFLLAGLAGGGAQCFTLARPGEPLPVGPLALAGRETPAVRLAVFRRDGYTWYEAAIPVKLLPGIEPEPGREFCFSLLVHDAESGRIRDWGQAAGLWPSQAQPLRLGAVGRGTAGRPSRCWTAPSNGDSAVRHNSTALLPRPHPGKLDGVLQREVTEQTRSHIMPHRIVSWTAALLLVAAQDALAQQTPGKIALADGSRQIVLRVATCDEEDPLAAGKAAATALKRQLGDVAPKAMLVGECFEGRQSKAKVLEGVATVFPAAIIFGGSTYGGFGQAGRGRRRVGRRRGHRRTRR